jgi:Endonuclease NucS
VTKTPSTLVQRKKCKSVEIRETQIEDILVTSPVLVKDILKLEEQPKLIGRQLQVPSGRLDMLYTHKDYLLLLELKVTTFQKRFIRQVLNYKADLTNFQNDGKLVKGEIKPVLLLPEVKGSDIKIAKNEGIACLSYNPEDVLRHFYSEKLRPITSFSELKPIDIGIWNIHLLNKFIYHVENTNSVKKLQKLVEGSPRTLYNKIKFAKELNIIHWIPGRDEIVLSDLGKSYVAARDPRFHETLSEEQASVIKKFVIQNPFYSSVVLGIASVVECIFALSKNTYPVPVPYLMEYFTYYSGKIFDWQTEKAKSHGSRMYSNYAIELGLLAKTDNNIYMTPEGFKFTIQMQLHKSLRLMDNLVIN